MKHRLKQLFAASLAGVITAGAQINTAPINVVAVGYDIESSPEAQQMLQDMARAARESGAVGEVIMAGQDQEQLDRAMQQAVAIAVQTEPTPPPPPPPAFTLELLTDSAAPGGTIGAIHSDFTITDRNAWIGFYKNQSDRDQDYLSYTFLVNLTDRIYDIQAPDQPGAEYHFRLFLTQGYDCVARSAPIRVTR